MRRLEKALDALSETAARTPPKKPKAKPQPTPEPVPEPKPESPTRPGMPVALQRLVDEVADKGWERRRGGRYNRIYHRHNR